jgi:hypothetical protein
MRKFEKRICILAIIFVSLYIGAIIITIHSRLKTETRIERIESPAMEPGERMIMMAELLPPMLLLLVITVCFIVVRKKRAITMARLAEEDRQHLTD